MNLTLLKFTSDESFLESTLNKDHLQVASHEAPIVKKMEGEFFSFESCKEVVREQLSSCRSPVGLREQREKLKGILENTIQKGQNSLVLLSGRKGIGKSFLVENTLSHFSGMEDKFQIIKINTSIHTTDSQIRSFIQKKVGNSSKMENLAIFFEENKTYIIIIDKVDLIATKEKQNLLYELTDLHQFNSVKVALILETRRSDILNLFEKRVESRLSNNQIQILSFSREEILELVRLFLSISVEKGKLLDQENVRKWNSSIETLISNSAIISLLSRFSQCFSDISKLKTVLYHALLQPAIGNEKGILLARHFERSVEIVVEQHTNSTLSNLSELEMIMVAAACKLESERQLSVLNFELLMKECKIFLKETVSGQMSVPVCLKTLESLIELEIFEYSPSRQQKSLNLKVRTFRLATKPAHIISLLKKQPSKWSQELSIWAEKWLI